MAQGLKRAEVIRKTGAVGDLAGDDLILTVTAAEANNLQIFPGSVNGSCDVDATFSIVDTSTTPKIIKKWDYPAGGIVNLTSKDFDQAFDFAEPTKNLIFQFEGATTPTKIFLQVVAYAFTGN